MKAEFLKLAGVKSEKAFYKKYPTEAAFFKAHPEAKDSVKKAQWGVATSMVGNYVQGMNNVPNINNVIQGQMQSPGVNSGMYSSAPNYDQMYRSMSTADEQLKQPQGQQPSNANAMMQGGMNIFGGMFNAAKAMKAQKEELKNARMWADVSGVVKRAAISNQFAEKPKNTWIRPDDPNQIFNINQLYPGQGVGTNALARNGARLEDGGMVGGNPTEIQNTYAPNDLYQDLEYEPLYDVNQAKSYRAGGYIPKAQFGIASAGMEGFGQNSFSSLTGSMFNNSGGSQMGSAVGSMFGPFGGLAGGMIGGMLDKTGGKTKDAQQRFQRNMDYVSGIDSTAGIHNYLGSMGVAKNGGWVSNDWNPQVITMFGDHDDQDFADYAQKDQFRAGGHLKAYREPSERAMQTYAMGGELKTHWGGYAEPMSQNPYLPGDGETVMFRGKSHDESDGKGNTGIGITYGDNPVEVERGEPATKLRDGSSGEDSLVVYGNLMIPDYGVEALEDKNAKGKKFKNYVADLSKTEVKQNKLIDKSTDELDRLDVKNSFDKLKLSSLEANIKGGNMKLKSIADKKVKAADLQNAINETAEEYGIVADDLARGKVKIDKEAMNAQAKYGTTIDKFQGGGKKLKSVSAMKEVPKGQKRNEQTGLYGNVTPEMFEKMKEKNSWYDWENFDPSDEKDVYDFQGKFNKLAKAFGEKGIQYDGDFGEQTASADSSWFKSRKRGEALATPAIKSTLTTDDNEDDATFETSPYKRSGLMDALGQILPYIRPTDQEPLDPRQLAPEMIAKVQNRLEPVNMQTYNPKLNDLYDISYQDVLNENDSDFLTALRNNNNNPQFKANLLAQKYAANSKVLGEQFRANQAMGDRVFSGNTATLNDAQKTNLGLADQQFVRQQQALTNTRDKDLEIAKSYADKYAKHALENRTLGVYENLYNYRYDKSGRAINMNAPFQPEIPYIYGPNGEITHKKVYDKSGKNIIGYQPVSKEQAAVIPSKATPPFVEQPAYISEDYAPIDEEEYTNEEYMDQVAPKKFGGKVKKKYSQSSIVRAFK